MDIPILIPAYKPDKALADLVRKLTESGAGSIIVVDDGSGPGYREIFDDVRSNSGCHVCTHAVNLGKGRAIKTGLNFALTINPQLRGVVTADADGQHLPEDILKVKEKLTASEGILVLGCRNFNTGVPLRSRLGNEITRKVFRILTGLRVSDTQTGLRGIPAGYIPECIRMDGEKYEYEINMLVSTMKNGIQLREIPIETVYIDRNSSSHFNPVLDSVKIYFVLFRFLMSSLSTALLDFLVFTICSASGLSILMSLLAARLVAGNYNFMVNKRLVFRSSTNAILSFAKYWLLVALLGSIAYLGIENLVNYLGFNVLIAKALTESLLFFISFAVQRNLIFRSSENSAS